MDSNLKKIEAASMLALGFKQAEVATRVGVSVKTIQRWKESEEFKKAIFDEKRGATFKTFKTTGTTAAATSSDISIIQKDYLNSIELYKQQYEEMGSGLVSIALFSLKLTADAIARLNPEDIGVRQIESLCRTATLCGRLGLTLKNEFIAQTLVENPSVDVDSDECDNMTLEQMIKEHQRLVTDVKQDIKSRDGRTRMPNVF